MNKFTFTLLVLTFNTLNVMSKDMTDSMEIIVKQNIDAAIDFDNLSTFARFSPESTSLTAFNLTLTSRVERGFDPERDIIATTFLDRAFQSAAPLNFTADGITSKCRADGAKYLTNLRTFTFWALQMYDATAKIPAGILSGNVNQFGDFDECLNVDALEDNVLGKYCLAQVQVDAPKSPYLAELYDLLHAHFPFRSTLDDPGHRVPKYSSINWGLCVPKSCTADDVHLAFRAMLSSVDKLSVKIRIDPEMCTVNNGWRMPVSSLIVSGLFAVYVLYVMGVTVYDSVYSPVQDSLHLQFSLKRNVTWLVSTSRAVDDIQTAHGIRFLNAFLLFFAHKSMALFFVPYANRTYMTEFIGKPWTVLGRAASLYTDPFLMLSGMLTTYSMIGKLTRNKSVNLLKEYQSRLIRLVPSMAALILFCTFVFPWISNGPQWNQVVTKHSHLCKEHWWKNFLFIHNYFGFENMCLTHTHHLGIDTQLFFISPIFIALLWRFRTKGVAVVAVIAAISTVMRYHVTYSMQLNNYIHFGTSIKQLFQTADYMYTLPIHRATVYLIGVLFGYLLRNMGSIQLNKSQVKTGHVTALVLFLLSFIGPAFMGDINYKYQPEHAAWYAAFAPIGWCLSFAWIIFISQLGHSNILTRFFAWPGFIVFTRLSYAIYLTQFPVFFYNVGRLRTAETFEFFRMEFNLHETLVCVVISVIFTLLFDTPFQNVKKYMEKGGARKMEKVQ